ncbi:MAG: hypothetical protein JXR94_12045, partial [Candidatus Hydrogenedentes bacterium]|nr:hypothetical protein [Candidatus Hydrogenedentota bacterium]
SHTAPDFTRETDVTAALPAQLAGAIRQALDNLAPAHLQVARGKEDTVAFCRRYRMKDGSVRTNPGIMNPDVAEPLGTPDYTVEVLVAADGRPIGGLVHYGLHCDTVGGTEISADWTYSLRECLRESLGPDLALLTPIGTAGDVNHWNVFKPAPARGFAGTERIGRAIGRAALDALEHAESVRPGPVRGLRKTIEVDLRYPTDDELAEARRIWEQPPSDKADFTLDRVEAGRRIRAAARGRTTALDVTVLAMGDVALVGVPCELFTELGLDIKGRSPFDHTLVVTLADANIGYVGPRKAHEEGGYEMTSTLLAAGMAEKLADTAVELLCAAHAAK